MNIKYNYSNMLLLIVGMFISFASQNAFAQRDKNINRSYFKQLGEELPTPNVYRAGSGAPGHAYWQQKVDYKIKLTLDDEKQRITGAETITYHNNSPNELSYFWVQLDQNMRAKDSDTYKTATGTLNAKNTLGGISRATGNSDFEGGFNIEAVMTTDGAKLPFTINRTMMRVDLPTSLKPNEKYSFQIKWNYNIQDQLKYGGRSGYEYFEKDGNYLYEIAQFFPRMAVYDDVNGWLHKQFLGRGEFALEFGDYDVEMTVPADHILGATGVLQNPEEVLTETQKERWEKAQKSDVPVVIVTQDEATKAEKNKAKDTKTWKFRAENVRDFAFASSRKFIWDAMAVKMSNGNNVMAMSYYPKEGNPLWGQYSTEVVAHTLEVYSKHTIDYPYPVAISVHGPVWGMEYPMICFNGGRPETDGTYSSRIKYAMISVIIHEVGHNFFPMIVNSDERHWTWMDEGLNTFMQFITQEEWQRDYPSRRGNAADIVDYMKGSKAGIMPIMTNSESILQFGNNAYGKPATALNILRETVMGRELFDYAFKEYAERWAFKHPKPADFFRTMEDASGTDLDWFWWGWFYTTDNVDVSIENVTFFEPNSQTAEIEKATTKKQESITSQRNKTALETTRLERRPQLKDFYNSYDGSTTAAEAKSNYEDYMNGLTDEERTFIKNNPYFYQVDFKNVGGLVMPVIIEFTYADGSKEMQKIPAEVWRKDNEMFSKVFMTKKKVVSFHLDPNLETADTDVYNNSYPRQEVPTRFELYRRDRNYSSPNPMQMNKKKKN
ncbi:aminopeptidase N [Bernardetia litoralis DSM 6794]|uniref:Aminopeptidase N n=1 Tax=Bernardetia litoralis (strain ATCC 23117 / DSM 6794 / NBRC 15988 / NCIMB 1366 / Fx l1 / Sio-4) TaxID=880071 RepID=I4AH19_BERLS|nr:M1 family metallopeptidase [Bernardetia litoralis]AFM03254.1 aminopeptidase N [Bernardetia litoralis DSM 6794]